MWKKCANITEKKDVFTNTKKKKTVVKIYVMYTNINKCVYFLVSCTNTFYTFEVAIKFCTNFCFSALNAYKYVCKFMLQFQTNTCRKRKQNQNFMTKNADENAKKNAEMCKFILNLCMKKVN